MHDPDAFIRANTVIAALPSVPEISLHLADEVLKFLPLGGVGSFDLRDQVVEAHHFAADRLASRVGRQERLGIGNGIGLAFKWHHAISGSLAAAGHDDGGQGQGHDTAPAHSLHESRFLINALDE